MSYTNSNLDKYNLYKLIKDCIIYSLDYLNLILTRISAKFNSPRLCSFSWMIAIKRHNFFTKIKKKNILILYRSLGVEDFNYFSNKDKKKISFFIFPRRQILAVFETFFGSRNHHLIRDDNYDIQDENIELKKKKYRAFLEKSLALLNRKYKFSTIVGLNFSFHTERELQAAAQNNKVKFISLHKESIIFPGELFAYKDMFKKLGKYQGEKILVYNDYIRKAVISTKFVEPKKIISIGMPRADFYYKLKKDTYNTVKKKYFLILIINTKRNIFFIKKYKNYKKKLKFNLREIVWDKVAKKTIKCVLNFAKRNKDIDFIFKVKNPIKKKSQLKKIYLEEISNNDKLNNCKIVSDVNTGRLIKEAELIIGFNSTAIIESLILKKNVVVPTFNINKKLLKDFTLDLGKTVFYPKNVNDLNLILKKAAVKKLYKKNDDLTIKRLAKKYIGNNDGNSTKRLLKEI